MKTAYIFLSLIYTLNATPTVDKIKGSIVQLKDHSTTVKLNTAIDLVLDAARWAFEHDGEINLSLPNISKPFGKPPFNGNFSAEEGVFTNLASLQRTGDVAAFKNGSQVGVYASFGLQTFKASFNNYSLDILKIHQSGYMNASIGNNSLSMKISLTYSPKCSFDLDYVKFESLADFKLNITGLGNFQMLFNEISSWLFDNFTPNLKEIVNEKLVEKLGKAIKKVNLCEYIPVI